MGQLRSRTLVLPVVDLNVLNSYFISVQAPSSVNPIVPLNPSDYLELNGDQDIQHLFFFRHITPNDVLHGIKAQSSNARGCDEINLRIIELFKPVMFYYIVDLFNFSLMYSVVPETWKKSLIVPIKKVASPVNPSDYRPISILCTLSKIWKRLSTTNYMITFLKVIS